MIEGRRVADILDFRTEPMEHIRDDDDVESNLYRYVWESAEQTSQRRRRTEQHGAPAMGLRRTPLTHRPPPQPSSPRSVMHSPIHWPVPTIAIFMDRTGVAESVARQLESRGRHVVRIAVGDQFQSTDDGALHVSPSTQKRT